MELILFIVSVLFGFFFGSYIEKKHYESIKARESELLHLPVVTAKNFIDESTPVRKTEFVQGSITISSDGFKTLLGALANLFGGRITAFENLIDRARREAVLRLKEKAREADLILNLRIETSFITSEGSVEVFAYATAVYYAKHG